MERQLAKPDVFLVDHCQQVSESFASLFGTYDRPTRLAKRWFYFFKLQPDKMKSFYTVGFLACLLHDIGKANSEFQGMLKKTVEKQAIRHEVLSVLIIQRMGFLTEILDLDCDILLSAILCHHLKADGDKICDLRSERTTWEVSQEGVDEIIDVAARYYPQFKKFLIQKNWKFDFDEMKRLQGRFYKLGKELKRDEQRFRLLLTVRSALILADGSASAIIRNNLEVCEWIGRCFNRPTIEAEYIRENIVNPTIQKISNFRWEKFQNIAKELPNLSGIIAPTGRGKSLASWQWVIGQCEKDPPMRVIQSHQTRATANESFRDYISLALEVDATLVHGTSRYSLEHMFMGFDERSEKDYQTNNKLYSIGYWEKSIFSATIDQFLGFMQNVYQSICFLPLLADGLLIVDEIHNCDSSLFLAFKKFVSFFNVRCLVMTASLTPQRKKELEECGFSFYPSTEEDIKEIRRLAKLPRHRVHIVTEEQASQIVNKSRDKRILWVSNIINRCQTIAMREGGLCYHARFKLSDKNRIHRTVIDAFKQTKKSALAVTTQICEMSFDLNSQILITEWAPIVSSIQRFGRNNRHIENILRGDIGDIYIYLPNYEGNVDVRPYAQEDFEGVLNFLAEIQNKVVSQAELQDLLERFSQEVTESNKYISFLESGAFAVAREEKLRDIGTHNVDCIHQDDMQEFLDLKRNHKPYSGLVIPAPKQWTEGDDYPKITDRPYDSQYGLLAG